MSSSFANFPNNKLIHRSFLSRSPNSPRNCFNNFMNWVVFLCGALALLPIIAVLSYVLIKGIDSLSWSMFIELPPPPLVEGGGFRNAIFGTLLMVGIGSIIAVPFGILVAIYLVEFSSGKLSWWIRFATNILSGIPSIIAGVFTYGLLVHTGIVGYSPIAGGVALAVLMLPIIIRTTDEALQLVPNDLRQASVSLGATNFQTVTQVVLIAALPAIVTGISLAVARAAGETAPLIFTALFSQFPFNGFVQPIASLALLVFNFAIVPYPNQQSLAWGASLILVLMVLMTSIIARLVTSRKS
ncbi:Phosphate transport system permease protein PstA (TC 3.A.1.7.1) [Richelia intracellularis HM01]|uniref:Phosphate transport system permease protein PstA n=1 Tax=Richelia intracellularis HH01 TaxID=1165094 RepID=M1X4K2_9NOST|nr:phosphate ABC transporter permease PstA [Richelia intracellularis]CCH65351.1 Phosphate transport system permease protein PstA (TC 3.A.1.7.1) [Richelia intracellularis HM01]CCH66291.1 Phosphate transport system permease protein PstA (TC 3.A.1.7.1) [Richelia intracellularis HH01]HAE06064.1 phosphate ABC transporter permease PtsA [Richelia sp.]